MKVVRKAIESAARVGLPLAILVYIVAGWRGAAGFAIAVATVSLSVLSIGYFATAISPLPSSLSNIRVTLALLLVKAPLFWLAAYWVVRLGSPALPCAGVGFLLVYSCLVHASLRSN